MLDEGQFTALLVRKASPVRQRSSMGLAVAVCLLVGIRQFGVCTRGFRLSRVMGPIGDGFHLMVLYLYVLHRDGECR